MLMITRSEGSDLTHTLKVEGKLWDHGSASWSRPAVSRISTRSECCLDLAGLTFVDAEGARFLDGLLREGPRVVACYGVRCGDAPPWNGL